MQLFLTTMPMVAIDLPSPQDLTGKVIKERNASFISGDFHDIWKGRWDIYVGHSVSVRFFVVTHRCMLNCCQQVNVKVLKGSGDHSRLLRVSTTSKEEELY